MRQVARPACPPVLSDVSSAEVDYARSGKINRNLYSGAQVRTALENLYLRKCFLCERLIDDDGGEVEHFLPHHPTFPERAYRWENLHWTCGDCNGRKKGHPYREPSKNSAPAERTNLLDPSNIPNGLLLRDLLGFDEDAVAFAKNCVAAPIVSGLATHTANFLNDALPKGLRLNRLNGALKVCAQKGHAPFWREILDHKPIDVAAKSGDEQTRLIGALDAADSLYATYLRETQPFAMCLREAIFDILKITWMEFRELSDAFRDFKKVAHLGS